MKRLNAGFFKHQKGLDSTLTLIIVRHLEISLSSLDLSFLKCKMRLRTLPGMK